MLLSIWVILFLLISIEKNIVDESDCKLLKFYNQLTTFNSLYTRDELHQMSEKYVICRLKKGPIKSYKFSQTMTPNQINSIHYQNFDKIIVNVPKNYKFYKNSFNMNFDAYNIVPIDMGPITKVSGLCFTNITSDVFIYGDSDIMYNHNNFDSLTQFVNDETVFSSHGGMYLDNSRFSSYSFDVFESVFKIKNLFVKSDILYGFSGVVLTKFVLNLFCQQKYYLKFILCPACFTVDDEVMSRFFLDNDVNMISNSFQNVILTTEESEKNLLSNKLFYPAHKKHCFECLDLKSSNKLIRILTNLSGERRVELNELISLGYNIDIINESDVIMYFYYFIQVCTNQQIYLIKDVIHLKVIELIVQFEVSAVHISCFDSLTDMMIKYNQLL